MCQDAWVGEGAPAQQRHRGGARPGATRGRRCFRPERIGRSGTADAEGDLGGLMGSRRNAARMRRAGLQRHCGWQLAAGGEQHTGRRKQDRAAGSFARSIAVDSRVLRKSGRP
ncbi:hypothetical protein M3J09_005204 [Ascochyta lentis]